MIMDSRSPKPRLRTTGGIVIGQGNTIRGRMPMAITDDPVNTGFGWVSYEYLGHHIIGFPRRDSGGQFSVGPVVAPRTRVLAAEWTGSIPSGGCQFWLFETYTVNLVTIDNSPNPNTYYPDGTFTSTGTPYISTLAVGNTANPGTGYVFDDTDPTPPTETLAWLLSVVYEDGGRYYLADNPYPKIGASFMPLPVWPADYITEYPL